LIKNEGVKMMTKAQELTEIMKVHPDRELIFMYSDECSDHSYTLGYPSKILVDEYVTTDDRVWLRSEEDELLEEIAENIADNFPSEDFPLSDKQEGEIDREAKEQIREMKWKKAIIVYINP
jgi:hypothetical protein